MRSIIRVFAGLTMALVLCAGVSVAGSDLNEVGAVLVFPRIVSIGTFETYVTITNTSASSVVAHVSMINGDWGDPEYCYECDFDVPLTGNDTELLVLRSDQAGGVVIETEPDGDGLNAIRHSCPIRFGMLVVSIEDGAGNTLTDNVLLGESIHVWYQGGYAYSFPAIPFQGGDGGDGDRALEFDGNEYGKLPRIVAVDFIASSLQGPIVQSNLTLFTPNFTRQFPPIVDCSITGYDADENPFSRSIQFGCWTDLALASISPEFAYPNLGLSAFASDTHGWLQIDCETLASPGSSAAKGGVHGSIRQVMGTGSTVRRNDPTAPTLQNLAAWGRLLYQSVTTGDAVTLVLEGAPAGLN